MELIKVSKKYGDNVVFDNFSYKFDSNKITVILGDSGVGKTTLISMMLGLTDYDGQIINEEKISCVFQNDRLIPNLTIKENLLLINKETNVEEQLNKFELSECRDYYPSMLSAGMSRRVAIIRALNYKSGLLIMDEPLRNLDYRLKFNIINEIKSYHKREKNTIIIVTHDIKEAVELADKIIIFKKNKKQPIVIDKIAKNTETDLLNMLLNK